MRKAAQQEAAARPPFIMSEKPIVTASFTANDLDKKTLSHFIPENLRDKKNKAEEYSDLTRTSNLIIDGQYLLNHHNNPAVVEKALTTDKIEPSVKEFIKNYAHQNGINWGGLNWLQFDYLHNDYALVHSSTKQSFIITPHEDGSVEFRAVYHLTKLSDINKSAESFSGLVNVDLGKGLILDTTYVISPKKEGETEASVELKSHTVNVLDKKVFDYIPALNPNPQEKRLEESNLTEQPAEAQSQANNVQYEASAQQPKSDSKLVQALKLAVTPFTVLLAAVFVVTAIAALVAASPVLIGLSVAFGAVSLLVGAVRGIATAISTRAQAGKTTSASEYEVVNNNDQKAENLSQPTIEAASSEKHKDNATDSDDIEDQNELMSADEEETYEVRFVRSSTAETLTLLEAGQVRQMDEAVDKLAKGEKSSLENVLQVLENQLAKLGDDDIQKYDNSVNGILERIEDILNTDDIKGKPINLIDDVLVPVGHDFINNQQEDKLALLMQCAEAYLTPKGSEEHTKLVEAFDTYKNNNQNANNNGINESSTAPGIVPNRLSDQNEKAISKLFLIDMLDLFLKPKDEEIDEKAGYDSLHDRLTDILSKINNADKLVAAYDKIPQSNKAMQQFFMEQLQGSKALKPAVLEQFKTFLHKQNAFKLSDESEKDFKKESSKAHYVAPNDTNHAVQRNKSAVKTIQDVSIPATGPGNKL